MKAWAHTNNFNNKSNENIIAVFRTLPLLNPTWPYGKIAIMNVMMRDIDDYNEKVFFRMKSVLSY